MPYKPLDDIQRRTQAIRLLLRGRKYYESNPQVLYALMQAKAHSDLNDYGSKNQILKQMIGARPEEFGIDSEEGDVVGLTHLPSNFKIHTMRSELAGLPQLTKMEQVPKEQIGTGKQSLNNYGELQMNKRAYLEGYFTKQALIDPAAVQVTKLNRSTGQPVAPKAPLDPKYRGGNVLSKRDPKKIYTPEQEQWLDMTQNETGGAIKAQMESDAAAKASQQAAVQASYDSHINRQMSSAPEAHPVSAGTKATRTAAGLTPTIKRSTAPVTQNQGTGKPVSMGRKGNSNEAAILAQLEAKNKNRTVVRGDKVTPPAQATAGQSAPAPMVKPAHYKAGLMGMICEMRKAAAAKAPLVKPIPKPLPKPAPKPVVDPSAETTSTDTFTDPKTGKKFVPPAPGK